MSNDFPEVTNNDHLIRDLIAHIRHCDADIERCSNEKQECEAKLKQLFAHDKEGATTYDFDHYKVTITTGLNHRFDKKKYAEYLKAPEKIDIKFPLVKEVVELQLNKKAIRDLDEYGSQQDKYLKSLFVTTTDKKLHISIKDTRKNESNNGAVGFDVDGV